MASTASRVFPAPPGPMRLISRESRSSAVSSASSRSRPMNADWADGSAPDRRAGAAARASSSARPRSALSDIRVRPDSHRLTVANDTPSWRASCSWLSASDARRPRSRAAGESAGSGGWPLTSAKARPAVPGMSPIMRSHTNPT